MAKYTSVSISGYNATPPVDDGTISESNKIKWATEKTKLTDPIKTALESINTNLVDAFDVGPTALTTNTTLGASHYGDFIQVSNSGVTLTLTDAATLGAGWHVKIAVTGTANVILARATGGDTLNGVAANTSLYPGQTLIVFVNAAANGFYTFGSSLSVKGECLLTKVSTNLVLQRNNGRLLSINGFDYEIPSAGVSLAPTSLSASTVYYIYAYMNAGTMTLEASATARATDATTGIQIKTGDSTRTLVGIGRTDGAVAWEANQRSWFNDPGYTAVTTFSVDRSTTSVTTTEINSEIRNGFLSWTGEPVLAVANGSNNMNIAPNNIRTQIAFNTSVQAGIANDYRVDAQIRDFSIQVNSSGLSEGYNYATLYGYVTANQGTWASSGTALRVHIGPRR